MCAGVTMGLLGCNYQNVPKHLKQKKRIVPIKIKITKFYVKVWIKWYCIYVCIYAKGLLDF
jgi:hypothetical protein